MRNCTACDTKFTNKGHSNATQCPECQSQKYFKRTYPVPCVLCGLHRKTVAGHCKECNEKRGIRQCSVCKEVLALLSFDGKLPRCRECEKERKRWQQIKAKYNLTKEVFALLLDEQGGGCAICGGPPTTKHGFHVDHDHETGRIRGILCHGCNTALGGAKDDPEILRKAAAYLES